jgi:hypothetical protein
MSCCSETGLGSRESVIGEDLQVVEHGPPITVRGAR